MGSGARRLGTQAQLGAETKQGLECLGLSAPGFLALWSNPPAYPCHLCFPICRVRLLPCRGAHPPSRQTLAVQVRVTLCWGARRRAGRNNWPFCDLKESVFSNSKWMKVQFLLLSNGVTEGQGSDFCCSLQPWPCSPCPTVLSPW